MSEEYDKYYKKGGSYELPTEIFNDLLEQLQAYKDKEYKLNRIINLINDNAERVDIIMQIAIQEILNEGSDE